MYFFVRFCRWDFQTEPAVEANTLPELLVKVWDSDVGEDDLLGVTRVSLSGIASDPVTETWYTLDRCQSGEVS